MLDENDVEFDFTMGHVRVIIAYLWIKNEKCKENNVPPLPIPKIDTCT